MEIKQKIKNSFNKIKSNRTEIFFLLIFISMATIQILNTIIIGSALNENSELLRIAISIIAIIEISYQKITKKEKYRLFQNILEVCIAILIISSTFSYVFKTYISFYATVNNILKSISLFLIYIIVRDLVQYDNKYKKRLLYIVIISGMITSIIGIDNLTTNCFKPILVAMGNVIQDNNENRMVGAFFYANTFGIAVGMTLIVAIGVFIDEKSLIKKGILSSAIFILTSSLLLSYSRGTFVLISLIFVLLFILIKDKEKRIKYIKLLILEIIGSLIYTTLFSKLQFNREYMLIWILALIESFIISISIICLEKFDKHLENIELKKILVIIISLIVLSISYIIIGLKLPEELTLFENGKGEQVYYYIIRRVEKNKDYSLKLNIEAKTKIDENYELIIMEQSANEETLRWELYPIGEYNGIKEINFKTNEKTEIIIIKVNNKNIEENQSFTIKELKVNDEIVPLAYKLLPIKLVDKVKNISITEGSLYSRGVFIRDSIKLIQKNPIIGYGGEAFNYLIGTEKEFFYMSAETHCYPIQIFLEQGIIGILAYIGIVVGYIVKSFKTDKNDIISITTILALGILIMHNIMDFDMTFLYIGINFYLLLALIASDIKKEKNKNIFHEIIEIIIIVILIVSIYGNFKIIKQNPYRKWYQITNDAYKNDNAITELLDFREKEKFYNYYEQLTKIFELIKIEVRKGNTEHIEELYKMIEEKYDNTDVNINAYKLNMAREMTKICKNLYEERKDEKYKNIYEYLQKYIVDRTLELEELWNDHTKLRMKKEELEELKIKMKKLRETI